LRWASTTIPTCRWVDFGYVHGPCLAAADRFDIVVHGRSGHAAWPHVTVDPLVAAASLVVQLQTIVSREVPPMFPAVLTVGMIQGGTTYNIIPDSCAIKGTVRTLHAEARDIIEAAIARLATGIEAGMRVSCTVDYHRGVPSLVNDDLVLEPAIAAVRKQFGEVADEGQPSLGGEDFALLSDLVPGFQLRVGSGAPGRADKLHNSDYQPTSAVSASACRRCRAPRWRFSPREALRLRRRCGRRLPGGFLGTRRHGSVRRRARRAPGGDPRRWAACRNP
jgi:amidohydrolase